MREISGRARRLDSAFSYPRSCGHGAAVRVEFLDDVDGKPAKETVSFALDGIAYEIDLSDENAMWLRTTYGSWVAAARRVGGRKTRTSPTKVEVGVDSRAVRAWAASNGIELSARGRVPAHVIEQYRAAGN